MRATRDGDRWAVLPAVGDADRAVAEFDRRQQARVVVDPALGGGRVAGDGGGHAVGAGLDWQAGLPRDLWCEGVGRLVDGRGCPVGDRDRDGGQPLAVVVAERQCGLGRAATGGVGGVDRERLYWHTSGYGSGV